ncbi:MAG TPA: hypothetical protein VM910_23270 [Bradyrhizobium sp.]|nr:hypothetical protein [Bradyrhizobium sp.]
MSKTELIAEMREDERERCDLRAQRARVSASGDGLVRKSMGDALQRNEPVPDALKLFGDHRDEQLVSVLGIVISITRRQLRKEIAEELAERDPQLRKIAALELEVAALRGAVDVLRGAALPPPAKFPSAKVWKEDTVYHEGDVVAFGGSTYQAKRDTAQLPGTGDWTCLARAGRDGESLTVKGTYNPRDTYACRDVVAYNGASFCARKSAPGTCPGPDRQLLAKIGKAGPRGERGIMGLRGERGEAAPAIHAWEIDRARYVATPIMSDGSSGPALELRALFEQFLLETSDV